MNDTITNILLQKAKMGELAHFYLLRAPQMVPQPDTYLEDWMDNFLIQFIAQQKQCDLETATNTYNFDVADILKLKKQADRTKFVVEDLEQVFQFVELHPLEFKTKLVIFYQAHFIDPTIANKLLKLLEEPTNQTTIFFLYGTRTEAIKTIESRAIKLALPARQQLASPASTVDQLLNSIDSDAAKLLTKFKQQEISLSTILEKLQKKRDIEKDLVSILTDCFRFYSKDFNASNRAIVLLQEYEQQTLIHLPLKSRLFPLLTHFLQHYA